VRAEVVAALLLGAVDPVPGYVAGVRLAGALVEGSVNLRQGVVSCATELTGCSFDGELVLAEARTRTVDLSGSALETLDATAAEISGYMLLERCQAQAINLTLARISGRLVMNGAHLANPGKRALTADRLTLDSDMFCREEFSAEGEISLRGAHIGGQLSLSGAHLSNPGKRALSADRLTLDSDMFCREGFSAVGEIWLRGAQIGGQLSLSGAHLSNPEKRALTADRLTVGGSMFCREGFSAEGEISLLGAHIGGQLSLSGAHLSNPDKRALTADRLTVGGSMFCREGFSAEGEISLPGAHIGGQLSLSGAHLANPGKKALGCGSAQADSLSLDGVRATGTLDLSFAQVRILYDDQSGGAIQTRLDGFTYDDLQPYEAAGGRLGRLSWLARSEVVADYHAQPYEQLAAYYRRLGHDDEARQVLVRKQRRRRVGLGLSGKITGYVLDALVGYGYRPARAFSWLIALIVAGSVYFAVNRPAALNPAHHPHYQPVLYTANLVIPIVDFGQTGTWAPAGAAQWIAVALTALGWILATAAVAGITRVLTRT
jgi:hypothetical protein